MSNILANNPITRFFSTVVGPAAVMAAGMIGAGCVSTRLLAGTWFSFDLLWVALYVIPMVIFANDSSSRIGVMSGNRGMFAMIKTDLWPVLAWFVFIPQLLLNILVINVSQVSVMTEAVYGLFGINLPATGAATPGRIITAVVLVALVLISSITGGFKRLQKVMTWLLMLILLCFLIVAIKGLFQPQTWIGLVKGLIPKIPEDIQVVNSTAVRSGFMQLMAIAGQALPAAVFLSFGYFTSDADYSEANLKENFRKSVINFGYIWGGFSVIVVVAGVTALHNVYDGSGGRIHFSQIASVYDAGKVIAPALPEALKHLATPIFSLGLLVAAFTTMISVALIMVYFTLDILDKNWRFREGNRLFQWTFALYIVLPGLISPFWRLEGLLQAILGMAGNLIMAPIALLVLLYFINKKQYMGKYTARPGRNIVLAITFLFSLYVVALGVAKFWSQYFGGR